MHTVEISSLSSRILLNVAGYASLDSNPIQRPALRLHAAGIIKDLKIPDQTHDDFQSSFFADEALLYFYCAVEQIEQKLLDNVTFLPEKFMPTSTQASETRSVTNLIAFQCPKLFQSIGGYKFVIDLKLRFSLRSI